MYLRELYEWDAIKFRGKKITRVTYSISQCIYTQNKKLVQEKPVYPKLAWSIHLHTGNSRLESQKL